MTNSRAKTNGNNYLFLIGIVSTAIWVLIGLLVIGSRRTEWMPLFSAGTSDHHLPLNAIGDTLAGFFAPLAFLWLFMATWMQRQELELQRKELSDTRAVLDAQMIELKRSADESNEQTIIMNATLKASRSNEIYQNYNLSLFYLARYVCRNAQNCTVTFIDAESNNSYQYSLTYVDPRTLDINSVTTVDEVFGEIGKCCIDVRQGHEYLREEHENINANFRWLASYTLRELKNINDNVMFMDNSLVSARTAGLGLYELQQALRQLHEWRPSLLHA